MNPSYIQRPHPFASTSNNIAGPSSTPPHRRQGPRDNSSGLPNHGLQPPPSNAHASAFSEQFEDASSDDDRGASFDLRAGIAEFSPPPPRSLPISPPRPLPYQPQDQRQYRTPPLPEASSPQFRKTPPSRPSLSALTSDFGAPARERLPSSNSITSMSSAMKNTRRAPAPAALDLSPRAERVVRENAQAQEERYGTLGDLGYGQPPMGADRRRTVTEPTLERNTSQRASRPLPPVPQRSTSGDSRPAIPQSPSYPVMTPTYRVPLSQPTSQRNVSTSSTISSSPSMPLTVPLSAVGAGRMGRRESVSASERLGVGEEGSRPSIDSYYTRNSLFSNETNPPVQPSGGTFTPRSPEDLDPSNIDRGALVGVGELATPRWLASTNHPHLRTPSMSQAFGASPPMPPLPPPATVGSAPSRGWNVGQNGLGLGMSINGNASSSKRQSAMAAVIPPQSAPDITGISQDMSSLLSLGNFSDFDFDSTMTAALAASLSIDDRPASPPKFLEQRASAPPIQPTPSRPLPQPTQNASHPNWLPTNISESNITGSPGSARSRIYARRAEREAARDREQSLPIIPTRATSKTTPPTSADSTYPRPPLDSRRTPPTSKEPGTPRSRHSPSTAHHDIMKHFVPKDFSHLPPSPSSASINQFLRGSGSVNNFASVGTPPGNNLPASTSYFNSTTSIPSGPSKSSLHRSDSAKLKSLATNSKWEGREVDSGTAEALRKLDGLGNTPGKKTPGRNKGLTGPGGHSRAGSPPRRMDKTLSPKSSYTSLKGEATPHAARAVSPITGWVDIGEDLPAVPIPQRGRFAGSKIDSAQDKRESYSSNSFVGTPTSRDSHSVPTSSTTPSSTYAPKAGRRASAGSDVSALSETQVEGSVEKVGETFVPPVPPIPKGYISMRQGLNVAAAPSAYVPLREASPPSEVHSPTSSFSVPSDPSRPKQMSKKWSFSSALSLKHRGSDAKESSVSPAASPSIYLEADQPRSPQMPWSEIERNELGSPHLSHLSSTGSVPKTAQETRSNHSITPVNSLAPAKTGSSGKRLTPSSIPFFRRASSSSISGKSGLQVPETPKGPSQSTQAPPSVQKTPSGNSTTTRKSLMGMSIPSMLRGSASKRGLSHQLETIHAESPGPQAQVVDIKAEAMMGPPTLPVQSASTGWAGRKRGKTLSISDPVPRKVSAPLVQTGQTVQQSHQLRPQPSVDSSLSHRSSSQSNRSESTVNAGTMRPSKTELPPIVGSPPMKHTQSSSSLRASESTRDLNAPPSKIPRIASVARSNAPSPAKGSMLPPSQTASMSTSKSVNQFANPSTSSRTMVQTGSMADLSRVNVSEFGAVSNTSTRVTGGHRAHLLAPMSSRRAPTMDKVREPLVRIHSGQVIPPSRRNMPIDREPAPPAPSSSSTSTASTIAAATSRLTAPTLSSVAKRASREFRPSAARRGSKETSSGQETPVEEPGTIKPSKSLHAKLAIPTGSRIPSSSSMGAPGQSFRKNSLVDESPSSSPAEDDEALADAEMMAYVRRRQARRSGSSRKEDLADIEEFPDDIAPVHPMSQRTYVTQNFARMSDQERKEVLDYQNIYFVPSKRITRPSSGLVYNSGFDDERGDYIVVDGDHMCYRYEVMGILGKGSFGQVVQCRDHKTGGSVAVKIIRNKKRFHAQALVEIKILQQLVEWDPEDRHYMVRMTDSFYFRGHLCIVTELLSINLYEMIKANQFAGFSTVLIRRFTVQMLASLQLMRSHRIVHCDLKPENVLLCHPCKSGIKTIDFGSSCHETEKVYTYIQSRFYRSPEVILGMNYAMAIDMWSLGCILAELYTGVPIFPGENEHEQLACIMEVLGVPDAHIVSKASRKKMFFDATGAPRPFVNAKGKRRRPSTKTLASVLKCNDELFIDFIAKCLTWDPDKRLKPASALRHAWIVSGRRRPPIAPTTSSRSSSRGMNQIASGSGHVKEKSAGGATGAKGLVISPPTPLMAKQVPASAPRAQAQMGGGNRLPPSGQVRNSAYTHGTIKASLG